MSLELEHRTVRSVFGHDEIYCKLYFLNIKRLKINENFICIFSGSALIRVGQTEQALGEIEREYIRHAHEGMCGPLDRFLEGEMRNITRERKVENISYIIIRVPIMCIKSNFFYVT